MLQLARYFCFALIFLLSTQVHAQSLFEEAVEGDSQNADLTQQDTYELNGYIRGVFYGGETPEQDEVETKSSYAESALKIRVRQQDLGDGFVEIRFRRGHEFGAAISEVNLREAYINTYVGKFDFRIGHQIVVWGRADGFNPTDNITPKNFLIRSPDEDDRREGAFLIRSFFNVQPIRVEGIWTPIYTASVLPTDIAPLPPGIVFGEPDHPDARLENSSFALKFNVELASLDGSVSYFNGYNPFPGVGIAVPERILDGIQLTSKAYRMHILGADFSTAVGSLMGLRGEFAFRTPHEDYEENIHIPNPDLQYVIGGDKEFGDLSVLIQYLGRYVFDFTRLSEPRNLLELVSPELALNNRIYSSQQNELSHSVSFRTAWKLLHETLDLELLGLYNFTTEEVFLQPRVSYDIADDLTATLGWERYSGPEDTLFGIVDSYFTALYAELKSSF